MMSGTGNGVHDGTTVYKPVMPPTSSPSLSLSPTYQAGGDGGSTVAGVQPITTVNSGEQTKRKRGRPRKYPPGLKSTHPPPPPPPPQAAIQSSGFSSPTTPVAEVALSPSTEKKSRGRPRGSGQKHQVTPLGSAGVGFTPHIVNVNAGEDVSSKIMSFSRTGTQAVCILSANGAISNVTLRQPSTSGGTVTYEGRFEILSLSGSFMVSESGGQRSRTGGLSVSLAGSDGRVIGGGVAGLLIAASPVQVVIGSFIAEGLEHQPLEVYHHMEP